MIELYVFYHIFAFIFMIGVTTFSDKFFLNFIGVLLLLVLAPILFPYLLGAGLKDENLNNN